MRGPGPCPSIYLPDAGGYAPGRRSLQACCEIIQNENHYINKSFKSFKSFKSLNHLNHRNHLIIKIIEII